MKEVQRLQEMSHSPKLDTLRRLAIFDSALDFAMIVTDPEGVITDWNVGAERILGWTATQARGQDASFVFTAEDVAIDRPRFEMQTALISGRAADNRWHLRKDGSTFWASGEMMPLLGTDDRHLGFVKILRDRTADHLSELSRRERARHRRALLDLTDQFASIGQDSSRLADDACHMLGAILSVQLCGYGAVDPVAETITVERDWTSGSAKTLAGTLNFRDYGSYIEDLKRGETVIVRDARTDPRTTQHASALEARSARAFVNMPVFERGQFVALLYVSTDQPRDWNENELYFIREVATRTHTATARWSAEEALRLSEKRHKALVQASSEVRFQMSADWTHLHELVGGSFIPATHEPTSDWLEDYIPPVAQPAIRAEFERAIQTNTPYNIEHEVYRVDGSIGWANVRAVPMLDEAGQVHEWYGAATDVTDRRRAELALQALNATLEQQIEARTAERNRIWQVSRDMLLVTDLEGVWLAINPAWSACLGWDEDEMLGTTSEWLEHPDDRDKSRREVAKLITGEPTLAFENRFLTRKSEYRDLAWTAVCSGDKIYAVARDVTQERAQEAALATAEEALRQSQKMEAVGQLTGGLAHDFNNLLAGISGSLELLNIRIGQGRLNDLDRYVSAAQGATRRAAALTHRLLAFSRRQTLAPKTTNVTELIGGLLDLIRRTAGPEIVITTVNHNVASWLVRVDPPQLENALLNLCINARDAMPEGGAIHIETTNLKVERKQAAQLDMHEGEYLLLTVADTGSGMTPEVMARACEPFFTTKPLGQGTGLGLSMIYGFARQSDGQLRITSLPGKGTTVSLYLPRHRGDDHHEAGSSPRLDTKIQAIAGETVLIVDDEPTVRLLITEVLEDLGYTAVEAADGAAGLRVLQSDTRIDLLITDVGLPGGMNGRQVADAGRIHRPGLKVLFITGYGGSSALSNDDMPEGMQVLTKPFSFAILASRIREMIG